MGQEEEDKDGDDRWEDSMDDEDNSSEYEQDK